MGQGVTMAGTGRWAQDGTLDWGVGVVSTPGRMAKGSWGALGGLGRGLLQVVMGGRPRQAGEGLRGRTPPCRKAGHGGGATWAPGPQRPSPLCGSPAPSPLPPSLKGPVTSLPRRLMAPTAPAKGPPLCLLLTQAARSTPSQALCPPHNDPHCWSPARAGGLTHLQRGCCKPVLPSISGLHPCWPALSTGSAY